MTRPVRTWLPLFLVLFAWYQMPEGVGTRWLHQPAVAAVIMLAFLPVAWLVARGLRLSMGAAYALEWSSRAAALLGGGFIVAILAKATALAIGFRLGIYRADSAPGVTGSTLLAGSMAWLALSTFVPSIAEDILTRGFWMRVPNVAWSAAGFVLFSSTLYVLNHIYRLGNGPIEWSMLFSFGLTYAFALWRFGSLWPAVGLHWGWNFAGPAIGFLWPYETLQSTRGSLLSAAAHVLVLAIVWISSAFLARRER